MSKSFLLTIRWNNKIIDIDFPKFFEDMYCERCFTKKQFDYRCEVETGNFFYYDYKKKIIYLREWVSTRYEDDFPTNVFKTRRIKVKEVKNDK